MKKNDDDVNSTEAKPKNNQWNSTPSKSIKIHLPKTEKREKIE